MPTESISVSPMPPDWWSRSLYDFLSDLPQSGWIWEFMRRARLKELLGDSPVDAMNPDPELEELGGDFWTTLKPRISIMNLNILTSRGGLDYEYPHGPPGHQEHPDLRPPV